MYLPGIGRGGGGSNVVGGGGGSGGGCCSSQAVSRSSISLCATWPGPGGGAERAFTWFCNASHLMSGNNGVPSTYTLIIGFLWAVPSTGCLGSCWTRTVP